MIRKKNSISKLLRLKDNRKKEIELEVKKARDRVEEEKTKLRALEKDFDDTLKFFNEKHSEGSIKASNIISYYEFFSRMNGKIEQQKKLHMRRKNELRSLKNTLLNAHKDKRMFEILNEKAVKRERKEKVDAEQKESDFFTLSRRPR